MRQPPIRQRWPDLPNRRRPSRSHASRHRANRLHRHANRLRRHANRRRRGSRPVEAATVEAAASAMEVPAAAAGSAVARRDPMRDNAVRPAMVVLVMVFRIAVNSNPSGSNGAKPKEFPFSEEFRARPEIQNDQGSPLP